MKFDKFAIAEEIKTNLVNNGYFRTTDIQYKAIPAIMNGEDVLAIAQTGSGKTAAFAIPIINQIHQYKTSKRSNGVKCLVLVPTRELAKQIGEVFAKLSKHTKASSYAIYGGVEQDPQINQLAGGIDILIATPGRMFDLISQQHVDISKVSVLVLDEADHMLDLGFIDDIESVKRKLKQRHQTLFFSATINPKIKKLAYSQISSNALRIQVSPEKMVSKNVTHSIVKVDMDEKRHLLVNFILGNPEAKCMIFVRTQVRAERVAEHLAKKDIQVVTMHGGMHQEDREKNLEIFRKQKAGWLIATDVTARGIDLPALTHVINYDLPDEPENYVHRVGRTGRGFAKGDALSFCAPEEYGKLEQIEEFLQTKIPQMKVHKQHLEEPAPPSKSQSIADFIAAEEAYSASLKRRKKKK
ncbi:MAG: DEAD/DEAH box helicase [Pseudobdellovibrio sp.]